MEAKKVRMRTKYGSNKRSGKLGNKKRVGWNYKADEAKSEQIEDSGNDDNEYEDYDVGANVDPDEEEHEEKDVIVLDSFMSN